MPFEQDEHITFIRGFLKRPQQVGSVIPSSRFLERRVTEIGHVRNAHTIVELGPGTGGTTRAILRAMPDDATLVSIEIDPQFHSFVSASIPDPRLIAHLGSAEDLREVMDAHGLDGVDTVISGIPFSTMNLGQAAEILHAVSSVLNPGGRFVAYQVRRRVERLCRPFFGRARVAVELFNIPPMWVYCWQKRGTYPPQ